jgi:ribonuclease HI
VEGAGLDVVPEDEEAETGGMSNRNWSKHKRRERMARHGTEERDAGANLPPVSGPRRAPVVSKEELRRQADQLLAGYTGPVTKLPAGSPVIGSHVTPSADRPQMRPSGNLARSKVARSSRRERRPSGDASQIERAVPRGLVIYADGACEPNPGAGGWAFVVYRDGQEIHADCGGANLTTNNIMELTGALMALRWFAERGVVEPVRLFCDSQYVVNGCNDWRHGWKARGWCRKGKNPEIANLDLWKELDAALMAVPIRLEWVKGHAGIIGNERADELSLEGRQAVLALQPDLVDLVETQLRYAV